MRTSLICIDQAGKRVTLKGASISRSVRRILGDSALIEEQDDVVVISCTNKRQAASVETRLISHFENLGYDVNPRLVPAASNYIFNGIPISNYIH